MDWRDVQQSNTSHALHLLPDVQPGRVRPLTANITGTWFIDDTGYISINGTQIASGSSVYPNGLAFTVPDADLLAGTNTLSVTTSSDDTSDDGVRVIITTATASPSPTGAPEPASLVLVAAAAGALAWRRLAARA